MLYFIENFSLSFFTFCLAILEVMTYTQSRSSRELQNFLCLCGGRDLPCAYPAAKSQLSPVPTSLCCQGAGFQVRRVSAFSLPPPVSSWWLSPDFCPCSQGCADVELIVSQEPLTSCMTEQRGHPQNHPKLHLLPILIHQSPCPNPVPGTFLAQNNTDAELPWQEERADTRALSFTAPA